MIINKGKQKKDTVQDKEVLLYKLYNILIFSLNKISFLEIQILYSEINNLEKALKML